MPDNRTRIDCGDTEYERFFALFAAYGVARTASKEVFPVVGWQAIYKRIKKNPKLYSRYREIASYTGSTRVKNALAGRTDKFADICRLIASGTNVYAAAAQVFHDRSPRAVIAEINKAPDLAEDLAAARSKLRMSRYAADRSKRRKRDAAYRQKVNSDPELLAKRREAQRRHREKNRHSIAWRQRQKLLREVSKEAKEQGVTTKEIHSLWKVPTPNEWRWKFVDYSTAQK